MPPNLLLPYLILPFGAAFIVAMLFAPATIAMLKQRGARQRISEDGPESHYFKEGTPTMGGLIIIAGMLAGVLVFAIARPQSGLIKEGIDFASLFAPLLLVMSFGLLGMIDDYLTIRPHGGVRGIASRPKALAQIVLATAFVLWLSSKETSVLFLGVDGVLSGAGYVLFAVLYLVGMANFVNITDGLDGLAAGMVVICGTAFLASVAATAPGLDVMLRTPLLSAVLGACLAFLWFNSHPAKVFMGDTGSLAIGVALPVTAILTHREVLLVIVGSVFVIEGLSVILQWAVFKFTRVTTGTGRRVFRKSPLHHHFELCSWPEQLVVTRFWILGVVCAVIGFAGALMRLW